MGILSVAARAAMKARKAAAAAKRKAAARAAKIKRDANKGDLDVDTLVKAQIAKANKAKAKREANEAAGKKAKAKTKAEDSGDISEVVMPEDRPSRDAEVQTREERLRNATGKISAMLTKPGPKPLTMDAYRSLPTSKRDALGREAKKAYDADVINKSTYETIIERIQAAELYKGVRAMEQGRANKKAKPVSLAPPMDFSKGGTAKPRTGSMDYRKGGLFK
jgi:hypothetical protein